MPSAPRSTKRATRPFDSLIDELLQVRRDLLALSIDSDDVLSSVHPAQRESAANLLHYVALRSRDLRPLQTRLAAAGLSSLGRAESHVLSTLDAVLTLLHAASNRSWHAEPTRVPVVDFDAGRQRLETHTEALLGRVPPLRGAAIMVTMPSEAADDYTIVQQLLDGGMDCMRINCAHDDAATWKRMIDHLRRAERATGRSCRILMDLAGPKLRTGPIEQGPRVIKVRPWRNAFGRLVSPARIWLSAIEAPRRAPSAADASLELPAPFLADLQVEDCLEFLDARGAERTFDVVATGSDGCWVEARKTCYLADGLTCHIERDGARLHYNVPIGGIPEVDVAIPLAMGDILVVTKEQTPGRPAVYDRSGRVLNPATISCTLPQVVDDARSGEPVWFDDGKIGGVIERKEADRILVRITHARVGGAKLSADKGINLPESELRLGALTDKDRVDLTFVAEHADMVALSFVSSVDDVRTLHGLLAPYGDRQPAVVLKIETKRGFETLPAMLLEAMKAPKCGVMIARGDLAVECGFERLAEVQEEVLWICEAAHVPVIWATQVLESLAKNGQASRAEITDAAMSHRAECVMLNKGPFVVEAVRVLDDILRRMHGHQVKKQSMMRELRMATGYRREREPDESARPALV